MPRFTNADIMSGVASISLSAKMQGLIPWEANLVYNPTAKKVSVVDANGEVLSASFLPEFEEAAANKDVMRALTATYRVLRATEDKHGVQIPGDGEESPIYWDNFVEDDETSLENLPYGEETARIIDEGQGGVIAYCHVDTADRIVEALRK